MTDQITTADLRERFSAYWHRRVVDILDEDRRYAEGAKWNADMAAFDALAEKAEAHDALVRERDEAMRDAARYRQVRQHAYLFAVSNPSPEKMDALADEAIAGMAAIAAPAQHPIEAELMPETAALVDRFADAMRAKLVKAQRKHGFNIEWMDPANEAFIVADFHRHIAKGDPLDVANYCAFMWHHEWSTAPAQQASERVSDEDLRAANRCTKIFDKRYRELTGRDFGEAPAQSGAPVPMTQAELDAQPDWIKNARPPEAS
ncbi:protein of unknown function [Pararobbsia alpina]|uniref:hypothetical protein n=1 Tax=Pararobbsia alpina TaxID=621374 RepID=UPI0039A5792E